MKRSSYMVKTAQPGFQPRPGPQVCAPDYCPVPCSSPQVTSPGHLRRAAIVTLPTHLSPQEILTVTLTEVAFLLHVTKRLILLSRVTQPTRATLGTTKQHAGLAPAAPASSPRPGRLGSSWHQTFRRFEPPGCVSQGVTVQRYL